MCFVLIHVGSPSISGHWLSPSCFLITLTCFQFDLWLVCVFKSSCVFVLAEVLFGVYPSDFTKPFCSALIYPGSRSRSVVCFVYFGYPLILLFADHLTSACFPFLIWIHVLDLSACHSNKSPNCICIRLTSHFITLYSDTNSNSHNPQANNRRQTQSHDPSEDFLISI